MHGELFRAYWEKGQDVSAMPVLREAAARAGVDPDAMQAAIEADTYGDYLDARRQEAEELMITGIPAHVIADRYLVMGAQPYDVFERVMERLTVPKRPAAGSETVT
jgi:predicted DsbA family dithiol-disulfide isomerase